MLPKRIRAPILLATLSISVSAAAFFYADTNLAIAAALLLLTALYVRVSLQDIIYYNPLIQQPFTIPLKSASEVEPFLAKRDDAARPLQPHAESKVVWAGKKNVQTELVVLYIHGWSSSPREIDPVDTQLAKQLGANSLRYRLTAHGLVPLGRAGEALLTHSSKAILLRDAATAYACAKLLGKRIVLVACSTGATLSYWLCGQPWAEIDKHVVCLISISPAVALANPMYPYLKWLIALAPRLLVELVLILGAGRYRHLKIVSDEYAEVWTVIWNSKAAKHLIALYFGLELSVVPANTDEPRIQVPLLAFANPNDPVVSYPAHQEFVDRAFESRRIELITDSELQHNICGRLTSPSTVDRVVEQSLEFAKEHLGGGGNGKANGKATPVKRPAKSPPRSGGGNGSAPARKRK